MHSGTSRNFTLKVIMTELRIECLAIGSHGLYSRLKFIMIVWSQIQTFLFLSIHESCDISLFGGLRLVSRPKIGPPYRTMGLILFLGLSYRRHFKRKKMTWIKCSQFYRQKQCVPTLRLVCSIQILYPCRTFPFPVMVRGRTGTSLHTACRRKSVGV